MSPEHHLWACANLILDRYGQDASEFVTQRLAQMAKEGDADGMRVWEATAARLDQLTVAEPTPH